MVSVETCLWEYQDDAMMDGLLFRTVSRVDRK